MIYEFTPKQDLHGYANPWAPGDGTNLANFSTAVANVNYYAPDGTTTKAPGISVLKLPVGAGTYTVSWSKVTSASYMRINLLTSNSVFTERLITANESPQTITVSEDSILEFAFNNGKSGGLNDLGNIQFEAGSTATPWTPYSNICPLEGYVLEPGNEDDLVYAGYIDSQTRILYIYPYYAEYNEEELVGPWISSKDKYEEGATPTVGAQVVDMGATPEAVQLTDIQFQTLLNSLGIVLNFGNRSTMLNTWMKLAQGYEVPEEEMHMLRPSMVLPHDVVLRPTFEDTPLPVPDPVPDVVDTPAAEPEENITESEES